MSHAESPIQADDPAQPGPQRRFAVAAAASLALAAFACTFTQVFNYDIFWHLAAGDWMLAHGRVLGTDPFSVDPLPVWVNVHWLFQVIASAVHGAGGFAALSLLKAALAVATMLVFAFGLGRRVPAGWLAVAGLATVIVIETRFRVRPEAFTLLFLTCTIALVEGVRRGGRARRLWLLVPIMLAWVNMHGLYVLGPAVFWSAMLGAGVDRRLRGRGGGWTGRPAGRSRRASGRPPGTGAGVSGARHPPSAIGDGLWGKAALRPLLAATGACFVSPWPLKAAAQPLLLWTRISGETASFSQGVSEFLPTWQSPFYLWLLVGVAAATAAACVLNRRELPLGQVLWLGAFVALGLLARRNVALCGPVCGYLLAFHGGAVARRIAQRLRGSRAARPTAALNAAALALPVLFAAACATEWYFRVRGVDRRFGPGLYRSHYALDIARKLGDLEAEGDVFCDDWGHAGTFIHFSRGRQPRRLWMDGRLEAHTLDRYLSQRQIADALSSPRSAATVKLPPSLRFFYVKAASGQVLSAMSRSGRFRLWAVDETGACFVRGDWPGQVREPLPAGPALAAFDRPLRPDLAIDGAPLERPRWWRANPPSPYYGPGAMFLWLGRHDPAMGLHRADPTRRECLILAARYLAAAAADGIADRTDATGMLAQAHQQLALLEDVACTAAVPVDYHSARALGLYAQLDLSDLSDDTNRQFAEQHADAQLRARRLDAAERGAAELLRRLPADAPAERRQQYIALHSRLAEAVERSRRAAAAAPAGQPARAAFLASPQVGLADQAIAELRAAPSSADSLLYLGDLLLNAGDADGARYAYDRAGALDPARTAETSFRMRLCLMVAEGRPLAGPDSGGRADPSLLTPPPPAEAYYRALALELTGRYAQAMEVLRGLTIEDEQLAALVARLRGALSSRANDTP